MKLADRLSVGIERQEDSSLKYSGQLRRSRAFSDQEGRSVRGATCREVFEALTLIAVLGLDRAESESPAAETPAPTLWTLTEEDELVLARDPAPEVLAPLPEDEGPRFAGSVLALWGGASKASFDLDLGLAFDVRWRTELLQPLLLFGVYGGRESIGVSGTGAGARLERLAAQAVACPVRLPRSSVAGVRPCVDVDAGVLTGSGVSVGGARGRTAPWLSTGVQLRAEWAVWDALELGAMIGGVVALSRPRFYFLPDTTAFEAAAGGVRAGASASLSF